MLEGTVGKGFVVVVVVQKNKNVLREGGAFSDLVDFAGHTHVLDIDRYKYRVSARSSDGSIATKTRKKRGKAHSTTVKPTIYHLHTKHLCTHSRLSPPRACKCS